MKRIFISGPYTLGDVAVNVKAAMDMANDLINLGFAPFCPHLTHFLHLNQAQPYENWLKIDLEFLKVCDALIRLPGESNGADKEVKAAEKHNIPVYYSIKELLDKFSEYVKPHSIVLKKIRSLGENTPQQRYLIVGGPGTGKSSLLEYLEGQGYPVFPEVARRVIRRFKNTQPQAMPWSKNRQNFDKLILPYFIKDYEKAPPREITFYDGGVPDMIAWDKYTNTKISQSVIHFAQNRSYAQVVFFAPPWRDIYEENEERPFGFKFSKGVGECIKDIYRTLGYQLLTLPEASVEARGAFVLQHLNMQVKSVGIADDILVDVV